MLLNLSNHPVSQWSKEQIVSAQQYFDKVLDIPFPAIDPLADTAAIQILAEEYLNKISTLIQPHNPKDAVHLMGELTFTCALVVLLQKYGYHCVASTTERHVIQEKNSKYVEFKFVRFRRYVNFEEII